MRHDGTVQIRAKGFPIRRRKHRRRRLQIIRGPIEPVNRIRKTKAHVRVYPFTSFQIRPPEAQNFPKILPPATDDSPAQNLHPLDRTCHPR